MSKPVIAYIAGLTVPRGRRMGHARAIISAAGESAAEKVQIMHDYGVTVIEQPSEFGSIVSNVLSR